ncbi:MAG: CinA family protein [Rhodospirillaceae bacterium]|nr:CinA family protein [Rhodospirillaceae bacterium]MBT7250196.1 CinA family protein [Rhodospirillaceae bacterium]
MMFDAETVARAEAVLAACRVRGLMLATAESCTGGLIAGALTAIAGSSDVVERGFVTYTNEAKQDMLGVAPGLFGAGAPGAVSEDVARAMAEGAVACSPADISVSVTGIAGPGGGTDEKPVGLVHMAVALDGHQTLHERQVFPGDRNAVRDHTIIAALALLERALA